jgi:hypothetical protein
VKLSVILAPLIAAGVAGEVILATVKAFEDQQIDALERRRQSDRDRQTKHRNNVTSRDVTVTVPSRVRVEGSSSKKDITGKEERKDAPAALSPCQELESVLDAEHAKAVVDHRQRLRKPLTAYAARKLANLFAKHPDPNAAADKMIESGWLKIEPGWGQPRSTAPPSQPRNAGELARLELLNGTRNDPPNPEPRLLEARDGNRETGGSGIARRFTVAPNILGRVG